MPELPITFIKGDKISSKTDYRDNLPINMIAISKSMLGADGYMWQHPGLTQYAEASGVARSAVWNERFKDHYMVSGEKLVSIAADGSVVELGDITGSDTASMPYSFNTQGVVADGRFYLYDSSNGFREVTDSDLGDPIDCVWVDGYYFFTDGESLYHTTLASEEAIDPLDFSVAQFMPDDSLGLGITQDNKVIVFGRYTTEFFVNQASENFAFSRVQTRSIKSGIVGTHAKCELGSSWYMLGGRKEQQPTISVMGVGSVNRVATREIDQIIGEYTEEQLSNVVLEARGEDGYNYVVVHLPGETLLFNETIAEAIGYQYAWSIVKTDIEGDSQWRAKHGVYEPRKGAWVYGDKIDGRVGILDESVATHYGDISEWLLYTPFIYLERSSIDMLEVETIPGHSGTDDATVFVSLTYDGVFTGSEWIQLYGSPSNYGTRFVIRRLGYVRDWFAIKMRGASRSRMAFARSFISYG